ncbi:hypothetical protein HZH66_004546 [Vespula vulgaris]|uniref:Uncharacterized protein n=1 Tax=Vespula vulgaris TaxID=7454 RepID=A0A834K892_VESVU|nr:hypothetical protein HZH66_004546 [Vespula vulgaris]
MTIVIAMSSKLWTMSFIDENGRMGIVRVGVASEEHGIRNVCSDIVVWEFEEDPRVETKYKGGFHFGRSLRTGHEIKFLLFLTMSFASQ